MILLPRPRNVKELDGYYEISYEKNIVLSPDCTPDCYSYAVLLKDSTKAWAGTALAVLRGCAMPGDIALNIDKTLEEEAYQLSVRPDGVTITGGKKGLLYGIQTLRQLLGEYGAMIPAVEIEDKPEFSRRGFYHDVTRGRVPTLRYLKKLADRMSYYKLNELQLYVEHTYLFRDLPELWREETPLTAEEILEFDEYCAGLGIELVPSLASFGHLYTLLSTKTYAALCELPDSETKAFSFLDRMQHHTMNVSDPASLELSKTLITEYMSLFRTNKFNLCADETFDLGKGRSKETADKIGTKEMYIAYVKELCDYLISKGKQPMFWGDVICGFPEYLSRLPKETICLNWGYAPNQREEETRRLAEAGAKQYVCPGVAGWNMFVNKISSSYQNIRRMCDYGKKYGAIGVLNTDWGDFGHVNHPDFSVPGMIYGACFSWNLEEIPMDELNREISQVEYHDGSGRLVSILTDIEGTDLFTWETAVRFAEAAMKGNSQEEKRTSVEEWKLSQTEEVNQKLKEIRKRLLTCSLKMDSSTREILHGAVLASDGIRLLNRVGQAVFERVTGREETKEDRMLAGELEQWFQQYKALWRSVSKEGDLPRISKIVFWYADFLRSRNPM